MHKVIASYLDRFTKENSLEDLDESQQFERFVNFVVLSSFFPDQFELEDITTGPDDLSIDGAAILLGGELAASAEDVESIFSRLRRRQQLSVSYIFIQAKRSEGFDAGEILKFGSGVQRLFSDAGKPVDSILSEMVDSHEQIVKNLTRVNNGRPDCRLFFSTTGVWHDESGLNHQLQLVEDQLSSTGLFHTVSYEPIDRERLIKLWLQSQTPVEATIPVRNYMPLPEIEGVEEAYLAVASATSFVDNVLTDEDGRIRASVFEQNVRAYLGDDNPVNTKIKTALDNNDDHDRFAILNNGVTIVSPDVKIQSDRISVSDYQIVNGCQTSHVLFRNREKITDRIYLPLKVIEADDPDLIAQVVEATNSQSNVEETQFLSIRPFLGKIENYFDAFDNEEEQERRLYFERRTRQYAGHGIGKLRVFDIQRLARAFAAMFLDVPHLAARYPTQTFQEKANQLFQEDHKELAYYTAALALYRLELSLGNQYVARSYQRYKWHLLMILKYQIAGVNVPAVNSKKLDKYCQSIVDALATGGRASATPFQEAAKVIEVVGEVSRDRLKRQAYTDEIKRHLRIT